MGTNRSEYTRLVAFLVTNETSIRSKTFTAIVKQARQDISQDITTFAVHSALDELGIVYDTASHNSDSAIRKFAKACLKFHPNRQVDKALVYAKWQEWCAENKVRRLSTSVFGRRLLSLYPKIGSSRPGTDDRRYVYLGIHLSELPTLRRPKIAEFASRVISMMDATESAWGGPIYSESDREFFTSIANTKG